MEIERSLVTFEKHEIRRVYNEREACWYFSVVDVVETLTDSLRRRMAK